MNAPAIRFLVVLSFLATFCAVGGCGPAEQEELAAVPTETQAPAPTKPPPPTATPEPTDTPVPPTATTTPAPTNTPLPPAESPTPAPTERVTGAQVYRDIDYTESGNPKQMITIYTPSDAEPPYNTLLLLPGAQNWLGLYEPLVQELINLGYAIVSPGIRQASHSWDGWTGTAGTVDAFCAYAWLAQNGTDYELDTERVVVFGHYTSGGHAATLGVADEEAYALFMTDCPHPIPETGRIAGVATFGGRFWMPEAMLTMWARDSMRYFDSFYGVPQENWSAKVDALKEVPPQEWRGGSALDEDAAQLARYLPLYWAQGPEGAQPSPPFLVVHAGKEDPPGKGKHFPESLDDSILMAEKLEAIGVTVSSQNYSGTAFQGIVEEGNYAIGQLATAIDTFMKKLPE
jgi:acetyl esterase/lipase